MYVLTPLHIAFAMHASPHPQRLIVPHTSMENSDEDNKVEDNDHETSGRRDKNKHGALSCRPVSADVTDQLTISFSL